MFGKINEWMIHKDSAECSHERFKLDSYLENAWEMRQKALGYSSCFGVQLILGFSISICYLKASRPTYDINDLFFCTSITGGCIFCEIAVSCVK